MLVLASASPRRRELLAQAGFSFTVRPSAIPEEMQPGENPIAFAMRLAREKADAVFNDQAATETPEDPLLVLGADTVVISPSGEVLGKPLDAQDAARMLRALSGATHAVVTGVALVSRLGAEVASELTYVTMQTLSDKEIAAYIETGEPMDKAGAYGIQGRAAAWIPRIHGCYFNVVGLPLALVAAMLEGIRDRLRVETALLVRP
ncbi:Maf family protein [Pseudacidobacterium ailaaui]|jgi:septum formation protein|uniref:Maf family protein n=1 Tax=Pseudacidobacterium ailaaui TaxID=1382359 RepID=UPI0005D1BCE9|nr:Maf family protein [Pseudacidobacterium ailaaui]MBX6359746.1 septum formation inhibitor Maf [Pseudacidobacterium ailaaui]MCL6463854.1 Maf family protein [Pseudacidobacterium ailaaui]MDI3255801.1 Maf family protein [Bacillota bacterium]